MARSVWNPGPQHPLLPRSVQSAFWAQVRAGLLPRDAGEAVGVSRLGAYRWYMDRGGGMPPAPAPRGPRPPLSFEQREENAVLHAQGQNPGGIAPPSRGPPAPGGGE